MERDKEEKRWDDKASAATRGNMVGTYWKIGLKRGRRRPRLDYCSQIVQDMGCHIFKEMRELAEDRRGWRYASSFRTEDFMMMILRYQY